MLKNLFITIFLSIFAKTRKSTRLSHISRTDVNSNLTIFLTMQKSKSLIITLIAIFFACSGLVRAEKVTINLTSGGQLKKKMIDLDVRPTELKLTGVINSADIAYINEGTGRMASVTVLDLSETGFDYDEKEYNSWGYSTGIGMGAVSYVYCLSNNPRTEKKSESTGLGGFNTRILIYNNTLAGGFIRNSTLKKVTLPGSLSEVGEYIFRESAIEEVVFPAGVDSIPTGAFYGTTGIKTLQMPNTVKLVCKEAFCNSSIETVTLNSDIRIENSAFHNSELSRIDLSRVLNLEEYAFCGTNLDGTLDLSRFTEIPQYCFGGVKPTKVILSDKLQRIETYALHFNSVPQMAVPAGVEYIGNRGLPEDWVMKQPKEGNIYYFGKVAYLYSGDAVETLQFKEGTTMVGTGFSTDNLKSTVQTLILPGSMIYIGDNAFQKFSKIKTLALKEGLRYIGQYAFSECTDLENISLPSTLQYIGREAFDRCAKIYDVTLPEGLEYIGQNAFYGCTGISGITLLSKKLSPEMDSQVFGQVGEKLTIGKEVTNIPQAMFSNNVLVRVVFEDAEAAEPELTIGNSGLRSNNTLTIDRLPKRLVHVGGSAFYGFNLKDGDLSENHIRYIGDNAFDGVTGLTKFTVNADVTYLGSGAFASSALEVFNYYAPDFTLKQRQMFGSVDNVVIGGNVKTVPSYLFYKSTVGHVEFKEREIVNGEPLPLTIGDGAFNRSTVKEIRLPDCRTDIGTHAFSWNDNLTDVRLGHGTETIGDYAFNNSNRLKTLDIPSTVKSFGKQVFYGSKAITTIYMHSEEPPAINGDRFCYTSVVLYVPNGSVDAYKNTVLWANTILPYDIEGISLDNNSLNMKSGESAPLACTISPAEYSAMAVDWESSNPAVATVDYKGNVTALSKGIAEITCKIAFTAGYAAKCKVSVDVESAINDITAEDDALRPGEPIEIYTPSGLLVFKGGYTDGMQLSKGIYIMKRERTTKKVLIK